MTQKSLHDFFRKAIRKQSYSNVDRLLDTYLPGKPLERYFVKSLLIKEVEVEVYWMLEYERRRREDKRKSKDSATS